MTMVEVFDGLSGNWGFSWGDMTADTHRDAKGSFNFASLFKKIVRYVFYIPGIPGRNQPRADVPRSVPGTSSG